jgi:hypothetical protein
MKTIVCPKTTLACPVRRSGVSLFGRGEFPPAVEQGEALAETLKEGAIEK